MKKNDELFELIKTLSKSEKRYIRMFFGGETSSNKVHMRILDAMEKQILAGKDYDEKKMRSEFRNESFLNQFHVPKNYLKEMIFKALRLYHANISVSARLKDYLRDIEILYKKGLYDQCLKRVKTAEKLAKQFDKHESLIELMSWKKNISVIKYGSYSGLNRISEIVDQEEEAASLIMNHIDYWKLSMGIMGNNFRMPGGEGSHDLELKYDLLADEKFARSFPAKQMFYFVKYTQNVFNGNLMEAYHNAFKAVELIEKNEAQVKEDPISYANAINNLIPISFRMKKYDQIKQLIQKVKSIPQSYKIPNFNNIHLKIYLRTYNHELELYRDLAEIEKGIDLIPEVETFLEKFSTSIALDYQILFKYQFAYFYFAKSEYSKSLEYINEILNLEETQRVDLQVYTRILNLMVHYELQNYDLIEYLCQSTQRFMNRRNRLFQFEFRIINFFMHVSKEMIHGTPEQFRNLAKDLKNLEQEGVETLDFINIDAWIQSKLDRTTFEKSLRGELLIQNK